MTETNFDRILIQERLSIHVGLGDYIFKNYLISTVKLGEAYKGLNLGKYETMVYDLDKKDWVEEYTERHDTEKEARSYHKKTRSKIKATGTPSSKRSSKK